VIKQESAHLLKLKIGIYALRPNIELKWKIIFNKVRSLISEFGSIYLIFCWRHSFTLNPAVSLSAEHSYHSFSTMNFWRHDIRSIWHFLNRCLDHIKGPRIVHKYCAEVKGIACHKCTSLQYCSTNYKCKKNYWFIWTIWR